MSEAPYMPLWIGDYLADTQHLSTEQHGAYLLILMSMWRQGGTVQNDPAKLARLARVSLKKWSVIGPDVMAMLTVDGDMVTQKRLKRERDNSNRVSLARQTSGARGNLAKSLKNNKPADAIASANANANGLAKDEFCGRISISYQEKEKRESANALLVDSAFERFWSIYPKRPNNPRKPAAEKFARKIRDGTDPEAIIRGAEAYARLMAGRDPTYVAQAMTWLNQERWTDDHTPADGKFGGTAREARPNAMLGAWLAGKGGGDPVERCGSLDVDEPAFGGGARIADTPPRRA